MYNNTLLN